MKDYQREFLDLAIECEALRFGSFTLKSGRVSPYFFNSGRFDTGARLGRLGRLYAQTALDSGIAFDMVYGPAYKGIALAVAVAVALAREFGRDVAYAFNRKEPKTYAEGGSIVGAPLAGRVLIMDDVISAGTSVHESAEIIRGHGATPAGVVIALDRQERGDGERSAVEDVEQRYGLRVVAIANLDTLLTYLRDRDGAQMHLAAITDYRRAYGTRP